jgi:hypothetical protein
MVLALLGSRIESLELGGAQLKLRAAAAERFALAEESEQRGDEAAARQLHAEAHSLLQAAAGPVAASYRAIRSSMRAGPDRTRALEAVVAQARRLAAVHPFEAEPVRRWLSAFEQYHAMRLAADMLDGLDEPQRIRLARTVKDARGIRFRRDSDRWHLSEEILGGLRQSIKKS